MTVSKQSRIFQGTVAARVPLVVSGDGIYITIEDPDTGERTKVLDAAENVRYCDLHSKSRQPDDSPFAILNGTYGKNHILPYVYDM